MGIITYKVEVKPEMAIIHYNLQTVTVSSPIGESMFIKRSNGKILSVVEDTEMTEKQKQAAKDLSEQVVKQSEESDSSEVKKSGS